MMNRTVSRRLERLEARAVASVPKSFCCRIHFVHPEKGLTGILAVESGKPTIEITPTKEDEEWFLTWTKWRPR
jgi:hypothetical protein